MKATLELLVVGAVIAMIASCAAMLQDSGSGNIVVDPVTGEERAETNLEAGAKTVVAVGTGVNPTFGPIGALGLVLIQGVASQLLDKKKTA